MSAPAPGPNGTISLTGRCGQLCACGCDGVATSMRPARAAAVVNQTVSLRMARPPRALLLILAIAPSSFYLLLLSLGGCLMNDCDLGALLFDRGGEFLRRALARRGADALGPRAERRIGHYRGDVGGDAALDLRGH